MATSYVRTHKLLVCCNSTHRHNCPVERASPISQTSHDGTVRVTGHVPLTQTFPWRHSRPRLLCNLGLYIREDKWGNEGSSSHLCCSSVLSADVDMPAVSWVTAVTSRNAKTAEMTPHTLFFLWFQVWWKCNEGLNHYRAKTCLFFQFYWGSYLLKSFLNRKFNRNLWPTISIW